MYLKLWKQLKTYLKDNDPENEVLMIMETLEKKEELDLYIEQLLYDLRK